MSTEKAPYPIAYKIMTYYFDIIQKQKNTMQDTFGINTLTLLIGTLAAINAPTRIWGDVVDFVLPRATKGFGGLSLYYEGILCSLAPFVSEQVLAKIVGHFASVGRLETLTRLTTTYLHRGPSRMEVLEMANCHCNDRGGWTDPKDKVWIQLFDLADPNDVPEITKLYKKAEERQKISNSCSY